MSTIGDRLRELRGSSSQREMADAVGIKWNAWARYESGGALPGADILTRICKAHAVSADWLLGIDTSCAKSPPSEKTVNLDELRETAATLVRESASLSDTIKKLKKML